MKHGCNPHKHSQDRAGKHMSILEVPGARLYFEIHGSGPLMVMVPGATGTADSFNRVKDHLAAHYTVVTYDRRGFSRSQLDRPQDYDRRLESDADDVRRLIEHVSDEPATVGAGRAVVSRITSRTSRRCASIVSFHDIIVRGPESSPFLCSDSITS